MATLNYAIEKGGPKIVQIEWNGVNLLLKYKDEEIANVSGTLLELSKGLNFHLPDDSTISIQLVGKSPFSKLQILRDGKPLPSSPTDPYVRVKNAYWATFLLGATNIFISLSLLSIPTIRTNMILTLILGILLLMLGFLIVRKSLVALIIAVTIQIIGNTIPNLLNLNLILAGGLLSIMSFIVRLIFLFQMVVGIGALIVIRKESLNKTDSQPHQLLPRVKKGKSKKIVGATKQMPLEDQHPRMASAFIICPRCKIKVLPKSDGTCPSCQAKIVK